MENRILVIEDEKNLARFIELELKYEGYEVMTEHDGRDGLNRALSEPFNLILLDLMLPSLSGMEICRRIRQSRDLPIIMITAKDGVMDRVSGLDSGADDYIVKPFAIEELLARMRALMRRTGKETQDTLTHKDLILNTKSYKVEKDGREIPLTKKEFDLLRMLLDNKDIVLTRDRIIEKVWGYDADAETNVVDVYIRHLRNKIDPEQPSAYIETVRGTGYVIRS
ncbi:response regulator transcription factor [Jeotgalibacillus haloalkalitolerans]|uniref:Response regulator transcription factor n=1 Tax=Jeotgalibacillus haloalkalitolerans TaxID=3104292 RepID=A0ABU5KKX4_9BACL|nr:response regulator transcription factor [Jeotgalibacillus sp. HH7-29]MDZ5711906.1 response regulator transcription factor [Jeotgalibacillus sp. HH7-29]